MDAKPISEEVRRRFPRLTTDRSIGLGDGVFHCGSYVLVGGLESTGILKDISKELFQCARACTPSIPHEARQGLPMPPLLSARKHEIGWL